MTEQEAIKKLESHIQFLKSNWKPHPDSDVIEALGVAINALEKRSAKMPQKMLSPYDGLCVCGRRLFDSNKFCDNCGQKTMWKRI